MKKSKQIKFISLVFSVLFYSVAAWSSVEHCASAFTIELPAEVGRLLIKEGPIVQWNGKTIPVLSETKYRGELSFLYYLSRHPNRLIPYDEIIQNVFPFKTSASQRSQRDFLRNFRHNLQQIFADVPDFNHIQTISNFGYRFRDGLAETEATHTEAKQLPPLPEGHDRQYWFRGHVLKLRGTSRALLEVLLARAPDVALRSELEAAFPNPNPSESLFKVQLHNLRLRVGPECIETVHMVGCAWVAEDRPVLIDP